MFVLHIIEHSHSCPTFKWQECFDSEQEAYNYAKPYCRIDRYEVFIENFSTHKKVCIKELSGSYISNSN